LRERFAADDGADPLVVEDRGLPNHQLDVVDRTETANPKAGLDVVSVEPVGGRGMQNEALE
jgi:hypothetical protein